MALRISRRLTRRGLPIKLGLGRRGVIPSPSRSLKSVESGFRVIQTAKQPLTSPALSQ